ncbi:MAG: hypothetical protein IJQ53_02975 [Clostridia bacterium]|nr:hypothetical protein [Clostridia bacterium]
MAIRQITAFVENQQGKLAEVTKLLADNGIDLRALSIADTKDFGILRVIVNDTDKAYSVLSQNGVIVKTTEVIAVELNDRPGEMSRALAVLDGEEINIEYLYAFISATPGRADLVLRVADNAAAEKALNAAGFKTA